jgi:linoleoyl-CoA desaturase
MDLDAPAPPPDAPPRVRFAATSPFSRELKRRTDAYFDGPGGRRRDLPAMYLKSAVILTWFVGSWVLLVFYATTWWQATLLAMSLGLSISGCGMSIQHDANHGAYSSYPIINKVFRLSLDIMGVASFIWRQKHNVFHHTFTNIEGIDFDLDFAPVARLSPEQTHRFGHRYQHLYLWVLYGLLLPKWVFVDDWNHLRTRRAGVHHLAKPSRGDLAMFAFGKAFFATWAIIIPALYHPLWQVALFHFVMVMALGMTLSAVFQLAHVVEEVDFFALPKRGEHLTMCVAEHQLATSVSFARENPLCTWYVGGLNFQVEHHLFPKVCHLHYPALSRIVEEVAAEHGIRYRANRTLTDAVVSHYRLLRKLGRPDAVVAPAAASEEAAT